MFKLIDGTNAIEELQIQLFEKDTTIAEMEVVMKFNDDKIKKLQRKKGSLEEEVRGLRDELSQSRVDIMKAKTDRKNLQLALIVVCVLFISMYCVK